MAVLKLALAHSLGMLLGTLRAAEKACAPAYVSSNVNPAVYAFVDPVTAPLLMPQRYNSYAGYAGGTVDTANLFAADTAAPRLIISNAVYPVPPAGVLQAAASVRFQDSLASGAVSSPLGINEDPFYGAAWFGLIDQAGGWHFSTVLTNTKAYAFYARTGTPASITDGRALFAFLVPIANWVPGGPAVDYAVALNADRYAASWRVAGEERLLISPTGRPIDPRFQVQAGGGLNQTAAFPASVQLLLGVAPLSVFADGTPHTACQHAVFNECAQSPQAAYLTFCQYAPLPSPAAFVVAMAAEFRQWSLVHWDQLVDCRRTPLCQRPDFGCPDAVCPCASSSSAPACPESSSSCPPPPCCGRRAQ